MLRGLVTAVRTLTSIPFPGRDAEKLSASLSWFPLVGLFLGLVLCGAADLLDRPGIGQTWPQGTAVLLVILGVLLTRGMHLDGLADWADGFWGGRDRERVLAIMKDPHVGTFGVLAIACVLLSKWVCLGRLVEAGSTGWIVAAVVVSRTMMVVLLATQPYARSCGGTAAPFAEGAGQRHLAWAMIQAPVILLAVCGVKWFWPAAILGGWVFARLFGSRCRSRVGGITGDLLGACSELVETFVLAAGAVAVS